MLTSPMPPTGSTSLGSDAPSAALARSYDPPVRGPILLASDGRGATDATFAAARLVAERLDTTVEVVGVLEPLPVYLMAPEVPIVPPEFERERHAALEEALRGRLAAAGVERWPVRFRFGEASNTIAETARELDSTMIVVGLGRHLVRDRILGGEHALRVVRSADRPVLAVGPELRALPRTAVVAVDFSPASVRAARAALILLPENGRLVLVYVHPPLDLPLAAETGGALGRRDIERFAAQWAGEAEIAAGERFARLRDELRPYMPPGVTIETRTREGAIVETVLAVADEVGAELVGAGTHGPGLVERFFVGSVASDLLRAAGRTVLIAPQPNPAESARLRLRLEGTAELTKREDWAAALEAFWKRNAGRRVRLEVDDPDLGAQVQETGFALLGVAYDRRDKSVELMMGDSRDHVRHLTRTIRRAGDIAFYAGPDGREQALRVEHGRGQTLLTFIN